MGPAKTLTCVLVGSTLGMMAIRAEAVERKAVPSAMAARPCPARGPGFIQLPGAETCLWIGGRLRSEVGTGRTSAGDSIGLRSEGRLDLDARTQTDYGPVRTFVRIRGGATRADGWDR